MWVGRRHLGTKPLDAGRVMVWTPWDEGQTVVVVRAWKGVTEVGYRATGLKMTSAPPLPD